jgi:hypothetical protein
MADSYAALNIITFPCNGKIPSIKDWQKLSKTKKSSGNYGVLCGRLSGITVIDLDKLKDKDNNHIDGVKFFNKVLNDTLGDEAEFFNVPTVKTPTGGRHLYFKYCNQLKTSSGIYSYDENGKPGKKIKIDVRNDNGFVVGVGSIHPDVKKTYKWETDFREGDLIDVPEWLIQGINNGFQKNKDCWKVFTPPKHLIEAPPRMLVESLTDSAINIDKETLSKIVMSLRASRADDYEEWRNVLWAIKSVSNDCGIDFSEVAINFSQQSEKFVSKEDVLKVYNEANGKIKFGSLVYWMKEDNPINFNTVYGEYKDKFKKTYYYDDYIHLTKKYSKKCEQPTNAEVAEYLRGCLVKINSGGNVFWFSRNKSEDGFLNWILMNDYPFHGKNDIDLSYVVETKFGEEYVKRSFSSILRDICNKPDFPIYQKVDFIPYLREKDVSHLLSEIKIFNIFQGFPFAKHLDDVEPNKDLLRPIIKHIHDVLCSGNRELFDYYMNYLAHAIQKPWEKPEICMIFIGTEGCGKDTINFDFLSLVFSERYVHRLDSFNDLLKQFNKKLEGKLITIISEGKSYDEKMDTNKLKTRISDKTINIEPKHKDSYECKDFQRIICQTNNSIPIGISPDDRRYVIHKIERSLVKSREYYNKLWNESIKKETAKEFFKLLAFRDISKFNPRVLPPTNFKQKVQMYNLPSVHRYLIEITTGKREISREHADIVEEGTVVGLRILEKDIFQDYSSWAEQNKEKNKIAIKTFNLYMEEANIKVCRVKVGNERSTGFKILFASIKERFKKIWADEIENDSEED